MKCIGCGGSWNASVGKIFSNLASELMARVQQKDLVQGLWHLDSNRVVTVETDASSVGIGGVLEVDGLVIENASWLRKEVEHSHINVAKLESVGKVNLAIAWEFKTFTLTIYSLTAVDCVGNTIDAHNRVKTNGTAEMLIRCCLEVIRDTSPRFV